MRLTKKQKQLLHFLLQRERGNKVTLFFARKSVLDAAEEKGIVENATRDTGMVVGLISGIGRGSGWHGGIAYLKLTEFGREKAGLLP